MYNVITIEAWKLVLILVFTFLGGYIWGLRKYSFSLKTEYDEDDERENEEEIKNNEES